MVKILLAEDDKNFRWVLGLELEKEGYTVDVGGDGVAAVLSLIDHPYQRVVLDMRMPRLNGNDTLRILKRLNPRVPVVTVSGNAGDSDGAESLRCGALKCFIKPFKIEELKRDIRTFLKIPEQIKKRRATRMATTLDHPGGRKIRLLNTEDYQTRIQRDEGGNE